mgnify:CR=1 FL=1
MRFVIQRVQHAEVKVDGEVTGSIGKGFLVLVAADASENTRKKFSNMCEFYEVPIYFIANKEELGKFCGKEFRASLAVQDENFAKAMMKELAKTEK